MHIYFLGICGTAMGNAALLLREQGHRVSGSDSGVYPPMSDVLAASGIPVHEGFSVERLQKLAPDCVVVGNAMSRGNEELEWLLDTQAFPFVSLPQMLGELVLLKRRPVVVTGTHGKTTTSSITAYLLEKAGKGPGWLIGGVPHDLPAGAALGAGETFVIEGDEYDSAFFDKRSKFIHYRPRVAVLNNLEFDHADIFRDLQDVQRTFQHFLRIMPRSGHAVVNGDDPNLRTLLPVPWTNVCTFGFGPQNDLVISDYTDLASGGAFSLVWKGKLWAHIQWGLYGKFNAMNAAAASLAAALSSGGTVDPSGFCLDELGNFKGVRRRQDVLFDRGSTRILEDFGHHPTAIAGTLRALRAAHPESRLVACFEPRSNTARSEHFQEAFTEAFESADTVYLGAVHRGAALAENKRLNTENMVQALKRSGHKASSFRTNEELFTSLVIDFDQKACANTLFIFFTNGSFDAVPARFAEALRTVIA